MSKFIYKRLLAFILAFVMVGSLLPVTASAVTQAEVDAIRAKRNQLTAQRVQKQAVVDELESQQAGILERKTAMDERNYYTIEQLQLNAQEIDLYDDMIAEKAEEVQAAKKLEQEQLQRYRARVRAMEENGNLGFLTMILRTANLADFLTIMDDMGEIMESDRELEKQYIAARENHEQVKAEYEQVKTELQAKQQELREEQKQLQAEIEEATALIRDLQEDIDAHRAEYEEMLMAEEEADIQLQMLMAELERQRQEELRRQREEQKRREEEQKRREEEQKRLEAEQKAREDEQKAREDQARQEQARQEQERQEQERQQQEAQKQAEASAPEPAETEPEEPRVVGTGNFTWPTPSCTLVTSRYGARVHPVYGTTRNHSGIDIGAADGAAIVAADAGTVFRAANIGDGYGNCVIIDHGNGYMTLYGHMSSLSVSEGQTVGKGDTIGYVGSTGLATGPHCHFEVWYQGSRTDPEKFFSGLSYL
ncbi:MAG: peptidoglycan DD-metalloendopeptidase family protein [Oscillospiraceae bacterium]|nr:peptidoglycan DD-metalloendopeptidase family protein [Oscillospiraceae bacterium]